MIINTITTSDCTPQTIVIGRRATYDTLQVVFDLSYLAETYGSGTAVLVVKRSQDETAYPATIAQYGNTLTWTISETDTYYVGAGECELLWYVNNGLAKTIIYPVVVLRDILQTTEAAPDAYKNWVEHLTALGAETQQHALDAAQSATDAKSAATRAEDALEKFTTPTASATSLAPDQQATASYSDGHFSFGIPRGATGAAGETPDFSIGTVETLEPDQPATATITGTPESPVLNLGIPKGEKGEGSGGGAVSSVNGKTGTVVLTASDVGAKPASYEAPVSSVAGKTGAVTLGAGDVGFDEAETYQSGTVGYEVSELSRHLSDLDDQKQDAPSTAGTAGQVLGLSDQLRPVWMDQTSGSSGDTAPVIINTASGDIASFTDGADNRQIRKIVGTIVPKQAAGTPSPDNQLPISGWTGANFNHAKGNLSPSIPASGTKSGITYTLNDDGTFTVNGTATGTVEILCDFLPIKWDGTTDYFLSGCPAGGANNKYFIRVNAGGSGSYSHYDTGNGIKLSNEYGTLVGKQIRLAFYVMSGVTVNNLVVKPMLNAGSSAIDYRPYMPTSLPVNWQTEAGTIYGGTVTLNEDGSTDVVVSSKFATYDGDEEWQWRTYNNSYYARIYASDIFRPAGQSLYAILCNCAKHGNSGTTEYFAVAATWQDYYIYFFNPTTYLEGVTDLETFKAYIAEHPIQVVYPLATKQTYHFSDIGSLLTYYGQNNIWIDTGAITECDYPADTKLYIDSLTAPDEDMIADSNIASGQYFTVNNKLYLSTAAIAAGATIIPGTNCTETNLAAALNALNT